MMNDEQVEAAIYATIAKHILDGLNSNHRDTLLQTAIANTIKSYDFRNAIDKVAAGRAAEVAAEMMKSDEWEERIRLAIEAGFTDYLLNLQKAIPAAMQKMMHGKDGGTYGTCAAELLRCWPKIGDE
jgi:hypothetical protein